MRITLRPLAGARIWARPDPATLKFYSSGAVPGHVSVVASGEDGFITGTRLDRDQVEELVEVLRDWLEDEAPRPCAASTFPGRRYGTPEPPEWCENNALPGSEFCAAHDPDA